MKSQSKLMTVLLLLLVTILLAGSVFAKDYQEEAIDYYDTKEIINENTEAENLLKENDNNIQGQISITVYSPVTKITLDQSDIYMQVGDKFEINAIIEPNDADEKGVIYKSNNVKYNNRKVLFNILEYCRVHGIKTVFWNKEDPKFCGNEQYNFVDTALHFDYIFTTAEECVVYYQLLGHKNVYVLPFGVSVKLYNPINSTETSLG